MSHYRFDEEGLLRYLKDRFLQYWPNLALVVEDIDSKFIESGAKVLVVGSGRKDKLSAERRINIDIRSYDGVDVVADGQWLPFADKSVDVVVCHQVLEHVPDADLMINEINRVLRGSGRVIISVPFYFPFHASPHDYRRWTIPGLEVSFNKFKCLKTGIYVGPVSGFLSSVQFFVGALVPNFWLSYIARGIVGYLLFPFKYLDYIAVKSPNAIYIAASVYYVGEKE